MTTECSDIFTGRIFTVSVEERQLPDGRTASFELVHHPGGAAALPICADGRILLLRQFRPAAGGTVWEIPAGRLEAGESPVDCIRRELAEETGYRPGRIEPLGELLPAVGFCTERVYLFVARQLTPVPRAPEPDEYIEVVPLEVDEALRMIDRGAIPDAKTQLALLLARHRQLI